LRAPGTKSRRRAVPSGITARLSGRVSLESHSNGAIVACLDGYSIGLGAFSTAVADRVQDLRTGLPLSSLASGSQTIGKEMDLLVRRLARHGLLEYRIGRAQNGADDLVVIEPQVRDYWPRTPQLGDDDALVLSRFAYLRRRGNEMVLESPRAGALFKICDPKVANLVTILSNPRRVRELRRQDGFPGIEFLALLVNCQIVIKTEAAEESNLRSAEGDPTLVLWDFHDLLFHARSTEGRHNNPVGGVYPHSGIISPLPPVRPLWPGKKIDLGSLVESRPEPMSPVAKLLRERHSTRSFDNGHPITLAELSRFLDGAARVLSQSSTVDLADDHAETVRPYPSAGASYELELYLAVNICEGLAQGFYHYDPGTHGLVPIEVPPNEIKALLMRAAEAMGESAAPQILVTIAARFGRVSWKYSSIAYSLVLKDVGVLTQTLYLVAAEMGLGGCAIGIVNVDQFEKMTGIGFHVEGPVGQFALGRGAT
jgi:SagB-type dehydrogenase family enzyme